MDQSRTPKLTMAEVIARGGISGGDGTTDPEENAPMEILDRATIETLEPEQLRDLLAAAQVEIDALDTEGSKGLAARNRRNDLYGYRNVLTETLNAIGEAEANPPEIVELVETPPVPAVDEVTEPVAETDTDDPVDPPVLVDEDVAPVIEGDPPVVDEERVAITAAPLVAAPSAVLSGQVLGGDDLHAEIARIWDGPRGSAAAVIGRYDQVDSDVPRLGESASANAAILGAGEERLARLASICDTPDVRREIPECGDDAEPVRAMFGQFPSDNFTIEFHTEEPLGDVDGSVGTWTPTMRTTYDAAVAAGNADAILAAQKDCYLVECNPAKVATALPVYACVEHTLETQHSHPQQIASVERRVRRLLARRKERVLIDNVRAEAFHYDVDAAAFGLGLGGATAVLEAIKSVMGSVVVEERIEAGMYQAIVPWGFPGLFDLDGATACNGANLDLTDLGLSGVVETKDNYTGATSPFESLADDFGDWDPANRGPSKSKDLNPFPAENWWIALIDPSSWFYFSPFDFTLGATREDSHVRGNKTRSLFIEGAHGLARNGCQPAIFLNFTNVCAAGVRAACAAPDCVEVS